jgi:hypothetical protein
MDVRISQGYNGDLLISVNHLSLVEEDNSDENFSRLNEENQ